MTQGQSSPVHITRSEINHCITKLATEIIRDYTPKSRPVLIGVMMGAYHVLSDLSRMISDTLPHDVDICRVSSYEGTQRRQDERTTLSVVPRHPIRGRNVIFVEDIVDTGHTIKFLHEWAQEQHAASTVCATLLERETLENVVECAEYVGMRIKSKAFVVGYGLDLDEDLRYLPYIKDMGE